MQNNCVVANTSFRFSWNLSSSFLLVGQQCMSRGRWQVAMLFSNYSRRDKYLFSSLWILARKRSNEEKSNFTLAVTRNNRWFMAHNSLSSTSGTSFSSTSSKTRSCFWVKMSLYFRNFACPLFACLNWSAACHTLYKKKSLLLAATWFYSTFRGSLFLKFLKTVVICHKFWLEKEDLT